MVTKNLLYTGVVGPILFIVAFLLEGLTRPGYSQWRNYVSQLATGDGAWVQIANFVVCGLLVIAFAIGLRSAIKGSRGAVGAPVLLGIFGLSLVVAGVFPTDPALGYPPGAPDVQTTHGTIHALAGVSAFTLLPASTFVMTWHFARTRERRWAIYSAAVGALIIVMFVASNTAAAIDATGNWPNAPTGFFQRIAIIAGWTWIAAVALHLAGKQSGSRRDSAD